MKKSIMIMALTAIVLSVFATPSTALPIYQLTGTLDWNSTGGADRLNLDGKEFSMKYEITNPTPTNIPDPNGMQSYYQGLVTLSIGGGLLIPIVVKQVSSATQIPAWTMEQTSSCSLHPVIHSTIIQQYI